MLASVPARPRSRGERRSLRTARRAASSTTTRCDASADSSSSASAPSSSSIARLAPSPRQNNLVATVAAKTPPAPPPPPSGFAAFARANWPVFVLFETVALIGAAVSGVSSRRKRLEIQDLNVKLREMMTKVEQSKVCEFNWPSEPSADDDDDDATPGSALLTKASNLLELGELDAAIATFDEAKLAISGAFGANTSTTKMDDKASAAWLGAGKGTAVALVRKGDVASLTRAASELKAVCGAAEREGDGTVFGLLGDVLTDLGKYAEAGEFYDRCLAMD